MRAHAVIMFVVAIFLIIAAMIGFYLVALDMISSGRARLGFASPKAAPLEAARSIPFEASLTKPLEVEHYSAEETSTRVILTFTAYKLIASDGMLAGDLSLTVPVSLKERFEPRLSEIVSCPEGTPDAKTRPRLEEDYTNKNLVVSVQNETSSSSMKIPIPLEGFIASSIDSKSETCEEKREDIINRPIHLRAPSELPVLAGPAREYPTDYYQLSANVQIRLPKGLTLAEDAQQDASESRTLPATVPYAIRLRSSPGMEGRTISLLRSEEASLPLPRSIDEPRIAATNVDTAASSPTSQLDVPLQDEVDLRMLIVRNWRTQGFVYALALLPLLLMYLLIPSLLAADDESKFTDAIWNLGVLTLAVLPLRAVLVPADWPGLTRIDYILALDLIVIAAVAFLLGCFQLWTSAPRHNRRPSRGRPV